MSSRKQKRYRKSPSFVGKIRMAKLLLELEWSAEAEAGGMVEAACPVCHGGKPGGSAFEAGWYGHVESCEMGKVAEALRGIKGLGKVAA